MKFVPKGDKRYPHQQAGLMRLIETRGKCALLFDPGLGKSQPIDEPVLTPEGWVPMGALAEGQYVIGSDGRPTQITGVFDQGERPVYRITFTDGSTTRADAEHLWQVSYQANRREYTTIKTTDDIRLGKRLTHLSIPTTAVEFAEKDLPIDPYVLGALLADGYLSGRSVAWSKNEQSVIDHVSSIQEMREGPQSESSTVRRFSVSGIFRQIKTLGLNVGSRSKFVPPEYMFGSLDQRRRLLAGLFDGDGSVRSARGTARYSTTSDRLAHDVQRLLWSIGVGATIVRAGGNGGESKNYWQVQVHGDFNPFAASRHVENVTGTKRTHRRSFKSIEYIGMLPSRCIRVAAEDHLYVTNDFIVTHNTSTALDFMSILALKADPDDDGVREVRVLVTGPLVAVDTWVDQAEKYVSDQVNVWSEVLGGSITQRAESLASRGGNPYRASLKKLGKSASPRAIGYRRSIAWYARADGRDRAADISHSEGPDGLGTAKPRIVLCVLNLDTFASRQPHNSGTKADLILDAVKRFNPKLVIVDEMHKIKGATSNSSRLLGRIADVVPMRVGLTGTVMPHGPLDVFGQWRFIDPYAFGHINPDGSVARATYGSFSDRFAVKGGYMGRQVVGYRNLDEMQRIMAKNSVVARKAEALNLPPVMPPMVVPVHLSPRELSAYQSMKKDLKSTLSTGRETVVDNQLTQLMRLRQITSGHLPDEFGTVHTLGSSKVDVIKGIANDTLIGESRVVIFSVFKHEIRELEHALKMKGTEVMTITGETDQKERIRLRKRFGSDDPQRMIMLAQIQTMSLSVNELVTASHAIFGSLSQQRDEYIQAHDRLNRLGQTRPVTFWYAIAPGTVDEVIMKTHKDRTNLESAMLKHIMDDVDG